MSHSTCIRCNLNAAGGMDYEVMRVTEVKNRGSVTFQRLEGFENFHVCEKCIRKKLDEINTPMKKFPEKFRVMVFALIAGAGLIISAWKTKDNALYVGVFLVTLFLVKFFRFLRDGSKKKKNFAKLTENNARFVAGWECASEVAPRKDEKGRGVFFIPATKAAYSMSVSDFKAYYRLNAENAQAFYDMLQKKKEETC